MIIIVTKNDEFDERKGSDYSVKEWPDVDAGCYSNES